MQTLIISGRRRKVDCASNSVHFEAQAVPCTFEALGQRRNRNRFGGTLGARRALRRWILGVDLSARWTAPGGGSARSRLENRADGQRGRDTSVLDGCVVRGCVMTAVVILVGVLGIGLVWLLALGLCFSARRGDEQAAVPDRGAAVSGPLRDQLHG
jgi:hypothetical protein